MSQQQITVMWVPGAEDGGAMTRVISVPMFNSDVFGTISTGVFNTPYNTYEIPVPDTAKVTWLRADGTSNGAVVSPDVMQKTVSTPSAFRFSKANALVAAIISQGLRTPLRRTTPSLLYGPSVSLTGATKIFDGTGIDIDPTKFITVIPTITNVQLPNKYLLFTATGSTGAILGACVVIEDDNPIRG